MPDREKIIKGLEFTKAMITFNPSTGEDIEPEDLNEDNKITYDACVGAITLLKEQEAEMRQLRLALDIAKGTCTGIKSGGGQFADMPTMKSAT